MFDSFRRPNGNTRYCFVHLYVTTTEMPVATTSIGITHVYDMCRSGIPKTVASVFGTSTAVAATVSQTISLVNWFDDSVFIAVSYTHLTLPTILLV